ncbi:MAG: hypothetical protein K8S97_01155 [Anaerolineae bacterium]|nr:hypothetical protein [Anaerolineae bacterium]
MSTRRDLMLWMLSSSTAAFVVGGLSLHIALVDPIAPAHTVCILLPITLTGVGALLGIAWFCALELRMLPPSITPRKPMLKLKAKSYPHKRKRAV